MKKWTLIAISAFTTIIACKKENLSTKIDKGRNTQRIGAPIFASFSSLEEYENYLNSEQNSPINGLPTGFVSLKSITDEFEWQREHDSNAYHSNPHLADTIYEGYGKLLEVLNVDKIVNLYGNLVKVDLHSEKVFTIPSTTTAAYDLLLQNPTHSSITEYSIDDEVARTLAGISGCNDPSPSRNKFPVDNYCSNNIRTSKEVTYQKAGIFFSLVAEAKNQRRIMRTWWAHAGVKPSLNMKMQWKPRCETPSGYYSGWASTWMGPGYSSDTKKSTFRPYSSTRALASYKFGATITGTCGNDWLEVKG